MKVAIVGAGFTPAEADQLRRAMATFKLTGGVSHFYDKLVGGMVERSEEHTSELQSLMRISYAVFCLKKKKKKRKINHNKYHNQYVQLQQQIRYNSDV